MMGTMQPVSYTQIHSEIEKLSFEFENFVNNIDKYKASEYIENIVYFMYRFIKIHPFSDENDYLRQKETYLQKNAI